MPPSVDTDTVEADKKVVCVSTELPVNVEAEAQEADKGAAPAATNDDQPSGIDLKYGLTQSGGMGRALVPTLLPPLFSSKGFNGLLPSIYFRSMHSVVNNEVIDNNLPEVSNPPQTPSMAIAPEVVAESTLEAVAETTPEAVAESTPEAVAETTPEAVAETTPEVVAETTPEAVAKTTPEAVAETTPEAVAETTPEAVQEAVHEAAPVAAEGKAVEKLSQAVLESAPKSGDNEPLINEKTVDENSYETTKEEIEDSITFIKNKLQNPQSQETEKAILTTLTSPDQTTQPLKNMVNISDKKKDDEGTEIEKEVVENPKVAVDKEMPQVFATECVPPVRPQRVKKASKLNVPEWSPPKNDLLTYFFSCIKPKVSD